MNMDLVNPTTEAVSQKNNRSINLVDSLIRLHVLKKLKAHTKISFEPLVYRTKNADEDVAQMFVDQLERDIYNIYQIFGKQKKMIFTRKDIEEFKKVHNVGFVMDYLVKIK